MFPLDPTAAKCRADARPICCRTRALTALTCTDAPFVDGADDAEAGTAVAAG